MPLAMVKKYLQGENNVTMDENSLKWLVLFLSNIWVSNVCYSEQAFREEN